MYRQTELNFLFLYYEYKYAELPPATSPCSLQQESTPAPYQEGKLD